MLSTGDFFFLMYFPPLLCRWKRITSVNLLLVIITSQNRVFSLIMVSSIFFFLPSSYSSFSVYCFLLLPLSFSSFLFTLLPSHLPFFSSQKGTAKQVKKKTNWNKTKLPKRRKIKRKEKRKRKIKKEKEKEKRRREIDK